LKKMFKNYKQLTNLVYSDQVSFITCEQCGAGKSRLGLTGASVGGATLIKGANGKYRCKEHIDGVLKPRGERRGNSKWRKKLAKSSAL